MRSRSERGAAVDDRVERVDGVGERASASWRTKAKAPPGRKRMTSIEAAGCASMTIQRCCMPEIQERRKSTATRRGLAGIELLGRVGEIDDDLDGAVGDELFAVVLRGEAGIEGERLDVAVERRPSGTCSANSKPMARANAVPAAAVKRLPAGRQIGLTC